MMNRLLPLAGWFRFNEWVDAYCPVCGIGALRAGTVQEYESTASSDAQSHEAWEPDWVQGFFTCVLRCQRAACQEITIAMGLWKVREDYDDSGRITPSYYRLQMTVPPLPIMNVPARCPEAVRDAVVSAAQVIWVDPSAAANRLRIATELLLDAQRIPRATRRTQKLWPLKLHGRIERLRLRHPSVADLLEAVKWIGNQGSHEDSLGVADVLAGAELFQHALAQMYDTAPAEMRRRAMQINKAKKIRSVREATKP